MSELDSLPDVADPADDEIVDDVVIHAARMRWPVARCGQPCGYVATGPSAVTVEALMAAHRCGQPVPPDPNRSPSLARLVVGCATAVAILIAIGLIIEDLLGVK